MYPLEWSIEKKIDRIARAIYGADGIAILPAAEAKIRKAKRLGHGKLPVCMAKTQNSLSDNPKLLGPAQGVHLDRPRPRDRQRAQGSSSP